MSEKRLAELLRKPDSPRLRQGVVDTVNADGTVDVTLGGSDVVIPSVACVGAVGTGAAVWLIQQDGDLLALGATGATGIWEDYTPVVTGATTNPATDNKVARVCRIGNHVTYVGQFRMTPGGSRGSGDYRVSLPYSARDMGGAGSDRLGPVSLINAGASVIWYEGWAFRESATTFEVSCEGTNSSANPTTPFTWGDQDRMQWVLTYETDA